MKSLSIESAENLAIKFRGLIEVSLKEPINVESVLRKLNIFTIYRPLSDNSYGLSLRSKKDRRFILINSKSTIGRQHFSIAHELFHLFYDESPTPHICSDENGGKSTSEKNADLFASALLMPKEGLIQFIPEEEILDRNVKLPTVIKLEQYYSVSRSSLLHRLRAIRLLSESSFKSLQNNPVKDSAKLYGYSLSLYDSGNNNYVIGDFVEKARFLYEAGKISEGHYQELLNLINISNEN